VYLIHILTKKFNYNISMCHTRIVFNCIFYNKIVNCNCSLARALKLFFLTKYHLHYQKYFFQFHYLLYFLVFLFLIFIEWFRMKSFYIQSQEFIDNIFTDFLKIKFKNVITIITFNDDLKVELTISFRSWLFFQSLWTYIVIQWRWHFESLNLLFIFSSQNNCLG
jgi:hypothetical protein